MPINLPNSPTVGQVFTAEGADFVWNGSLWVVLDAGNFVYATGPEAIAGVRADVAVSPATALPAIPNDGAYFWKDPVEVTRVDGTEYENPFDVPLLVSLSILGTTTVTANVQLRPVGGSWITIATEGLNGAVYRSAFFIVPVGWAWQVTSSASYSIAFCVEYQP